MRHVTNKDFVETKLATKFANFNIRVYPNSFGQETIVLWTNNLDTTEPVFVRVHSECLTGDLLGSLHCDCGKQLAKSLHIVGEEGGVLIYLRQEGRGIGLFEKMRTYQLQSKGYDTLEANTILGHQPDQRSYEMVKTILDDLNIKRIRLITNNPSKVSDIAKLGIEIVERVPLVSKPNKHNKLYLETKRKKFQHLFTKTDPHYYYQFNIDISEHIPSIIKLVSKKKKDPLLKIGIAVYADHDSLTNINEIERISSVIKSCSNEAELVPVVHFSFKKSLDVLIDATRVKRLWPSVTRLQINDLPNLDMNILKKLFEIFTVDIPISDDNFDLIYDARFRDLISKSKSLIMLDNSKGNGINETKANFSRKIDILLGFGLNNICLCGGFGPDKLDTYFELRRHYRINFSIDAETNLKTLGKIDIEKVKLYLLQLIRFDDPKQIGIEQTRKFMKDNRRTDWEKITVEGNEFSIHPLVFHPGDFPSSTWFASELCSLLKNDAKFCEVGCGSGLISCLAALSNKKLQITATDINPHASENTKLNSERLDLSSRITVLRGDVLDSIKPERQFDSIFWALPFGFLDPGIDVSLEEAQVFDPGYRSIRKFLKTAILYLKPTGRLLIGFSSNLGHSSLLEDIANECSIKLVKIREKTMREEEEIKFEILEGKIISN